jgi:hypothetical protein
MAGRPAFAPTEAQRRKVKLMVGSGIREAEICNILINPQTNKPISEPTLRKAFRAEINNGQVTANSLVAASLFEQATAGRDPKARVTAAIFWLKCRAGWKETNVLEHVGNDGFPIEIDILHVRQRIESRLDRIVEAAATQRYIE